MKKRSSDKPYAIRHKLTIGWLYPDLMSTYGDRGNITVLTKRCQWRAIDVDVVNIDQTTNDQRLKTIDLFFAGGAQDIEQGIVMNDLKKKKADILREQIESNIPALFVCGAPQLMGKWYEPAEGERINGAGIFDMTTRHPGPSKPRLIGNIVAKINTQNLNSAGVKLFHPGGDNEATPAEDVENQSDMRYAISDTQRCMVGFENHGGRTTLGQNVKPLAEVIIGHGNNGEDKTEGVVYKNAIGTYLHGPLLPKNPHIADYVIKTALSMKCKTEIELQPLDDSLEWQAHEAIVKRLGVSV